MTVRVGKLGQLGIRADDPSSTPFAAIRHIAGLRKWHIEQAAAAGATEPEVLEAVEVGIEMGGGPATAHARFALGVMTSVFGTHGDT